MLKKTIIGAASALAVSALAVSPVLAAIPGGNSGLVNVSWNSALASYDLAIVSLEDHQADEGFFLTDIDETQGLSATVEVPAGPFDVVAVNTSCYESTASLDCFMFLSDDLADPGAFVVVGKTSGIAVSTTAATVFTAPGAPTPLSQADLAKNGQIATFDYSPKTYNRGEAFTVNFSNVKGAFSGKSLNGLKLSYYGYSDPVAIGTGVIANNAFSINIPATYTVGHHNVAAFDQYGRLVAVLDLDKQAVTNPTAATTTKPKLPVTGSESVSNLVTLATVLLVAGGGFVAYRRFAA